MRDFNGETDLMGSKWNCKGYIFFTKFTGCELRIYKEISE